MEKNYKYVAANGSIYYFGSKGYRAKNKFITLTENGRKNTYYFGKNGKAYKAGTPSKEKNIISTAERVLAQEYVRRTWAWPVQMDSFPYLTKMVYVPNNTDRMTSNSNQ